MNQRICYVFASRSRANKFFATLDNIRILSKSDNYFVWAKLDVDDPEMNKDKVKEMLTAYPEVTVKWGLSEGKVHAINRDLEELPECDIIVMQSDDIVWEVSDFDDEIRKAFTERFPNLDGTVHFPDDHGKENTIIVSMLGINLYKKLGYLYHPSYLSVFCDNDFTEMTKKMGCYAYINKRLFSHEHPIWGGVPWDSQYRATEAPENYQKDGETFRKRKAINFGL